MLWDTGASFRFHIPKTQAQRGSNLSSRSSWGAGAFRKGYGVGKGLKRTGTSRDLLESSYLRNRALGIWIPPFDLFLSWDDSHSTQA